jgi:hypothetical protein
LEYYGRTLGELSKRFGKQADTRFKFMDFYNFSLLTQYLKEEGVESSPDKVVVDTLKEYAKKTGYIEVKDNTAWLTKKGLDECQRANHSWD